MGESEKAFGRYLIGLFKAVIIVGKRVRSEIFIVFGVVFVFFVVVELV